MINEIEETDIEFKNTYEKMCQSDIKPATVVNKFKLGEATNEDLVENLNITKDFNEHVKCVKHNIKPILTTSNEIYEDDVDALINKGYMILRNLNPTAEIVLATAPICIHNYTKYECSTYKYDKTLREPIGCEKSIQSAKKIIYYLYQEYKTIDIDWHTKINSSRFRIAFEF